MLREIAGTTTRGAVGPHLPALRDKTLFSARSAPSRHRKDVVDQQLGYDLAEPGGSGIKRRRQRIGRGIRHSGSGRSAISPGVGSACDLLMKIYSTIDIITLVPYIGADEAAARGPTSGG